MLKYCEDSLSKTKSGGSDTKRLSKAFSDRSKTRSLPLSPIVETLVSFKRTVHSEKNKTSSLSVGTERTSDWLLVTIAAVYL